MWSIYQLAKLGHCRASAIVNISDKWTAYQFDSAVSLVGVTIENALNETIENLAKEQVPKYDLEQLLSDKFRFPRKLTEKERESKSVDYFRGMLGATWIKAKKKDND